MARTFDMEDIGVAKQILGIEIHKDRKNGKLSFSLEKYVERILERFEMNKENPVNVPLASHFKLSSGIILGANFSLVGYFSMFSSQKRFTILDFLKPCFAQF